MILLLFLASTGFAEENIHNLSICCIFQNDAKYLPEWIEFHKSQGVEHFILYNNRSADDWKSILKPYVSSGLVEINDWNYKYSSIEEWNHIQCSAYFDCIRKQKARSKWIAFLDTDEFLFSPCGDLRIILKEFKSFGGVCINWVIYGTSNIEEIPPLENIRRYLLYRSPLDYIGNKHVKSIVQPKKVRACVNPHFFIYKDTHAVSENKEKIEGAFSAYVSVNLLRINHYTQRDLKYYREIKSQRKRRWGIPEEQIKAGETSHNEVYDPIISTL
ncbi:MAG: glycosyltransferase family 92 protein [Parachlamydiaceae bacterium]|nr:glycosyltransferase family 92 protein [Parachlamydiaceae bacterium]